MDKLVVIIAAMIKEALSWEEEHGIPLHGNCKIEPKKPLTVVGFTDTLKASENAAKEENSDRQD